MKKVMSLVMVLVCFAAMAGCGTDKQTGGEVKYKPGTFTKEDFALINTEKNVTFTLGMTKEEVESVLGKEVEVVNRLYGYSDGLTIYYREGRVAAIGIYDLDKEQFTLPYKTYRGITLGSTANDVEKLYGDLDNGIGTAFFWNAENHRSYTGKLTSQKPEGDLSKIFFIEMGSMKDVFEEGVTRIWISDGENYWNHK